MIQIMRWKEQIFSNHFIRSLSVLMAGTAFANVIIVATIPVLTRLYTPEEFGELSVFLSILFTVQIIASLRYETAIPLPKKNEDAFHLLVLSSFIVVFMSIFAFVLITFFPIAQFFKMPGLSKYIWLLSFSLLGMGFFQVLNLWAIRTEEYPAISKAKVMMNGGQVSSQMFLGFFHLGLIGLLVGEVLGRFTGTITYVKNIRKHEFYTAKFSMKKVVSVMRRYKSFPIISSWSAMLGSLGNQLPVFFLAAAFDAKTVGLFFLAQKILTIPEGLLGFSASQVYLSQSAQQSRMSHEKFNRFFWDIVRKMAFMGVGIIGLVVIVAPPLIHIVFGVGWEQSGTYIQILSILFLMKIIVNPITANFYVFEALKIQMLSESIRFLLIGLSIYLAVRFIESPTLSILCISVMSSIGYLIHGFFSWYVMKRNYTLTARSKELICETATNEVVRDV